MTRAGRCIRPVFVHGMDYIQEKLTVYSWDLYYNTFFLLCLLSTITHLYYSLHPNSHSVLWLTVNTVKKVFDEFAQSCINSVLGNASRLEPDVLCYDPPKDYQVCLN